MHPDPAAPPYHLAARPARHVVALLGQNENGILREATAGFLALMRPLGLVPHALDLYAPDASDRLAEIAEDGLLFAYGPAGVGARLMAGNATLWDALRTPFVSVLADNPCIMPRNHHVPSRHVVNGYMVRDWLDVQRRWVRSPQVSGLLPLGILRNPHRDDTPWRARPHRMVFAKTGGDPEARRARWRTLPPRVRAVLEEASADVLSHWPGDVIGSVAAAGAELGLVVERRTDALFGLSAEVDAYVRDLRATGMARALRRLPALIVGRGWDHLAADPGRATFRPALDASDLPRLYADARFLLNTTPNFAGGTHERLVGGFAAGCCVVSDANPYAEEHFGRMPAFRAVNPLDPDLPDRLATLFHDPADRGEAARAAVATADRDYDPMRHVEGLIAMVHEARVLAEYEPYA